MASPIDASLWLGGSCLTNLHQLSTVDELVSACHRGGKGWKQPYLGEKVVREKE